MQLPEHLNARAAELLAIEADGADKRRLWAVIYGLVPFRDGDQWCVRLGENIQEGVCGFGDTPQEAITDFEHAMYKRLQSR